MACLDLLVQKTAAVDAEHSRREKHEGKGTLSSAYGSGQRPQFYQKRPECQVLLYCTINAILLCRVSVLSAFFTAFYRIRVS
jgi:hypothetical protein